MHYFKAEDVKEKEKFDEMTKTNVKSDYHNELKIVCLWYGKVRGGKQLLQEMQVRKQMVQT